MPSRLADIVVGRTSTRDYPDATDGEGDFHLVRRHFDIRAFGVNGITGNAGDEMVEPHDERDDEAQLTDGHEELFAVMSGHAVFTVDGEDLDAPAGTLVFVRDPALTRSARATADGTRSSRSEARGGAVRGLPMGERSALTGATRLIGTSTVLVWPPVTTSANSGPAGHPRGVGFGILLFIITLGLYGWYWAFKAQEEMKQHTAEGLGGVLGLVIWILINPVSAFVIPSEVGRCIREPDGSPR